MKRLVLLGSTGSIGTQVLEVVRRHPDDFKIVALTCGKNKDLLAKQIEEFKPIFAVIESKDDALELKKAFPQVKFSFGPEGLLEAVENDCDLVINSLMGMRGLAPTYHAIECGHDIGLANKETLVAGGVAGMRAVKEKGIKLLPIDSEHSAIFQCLEGNQNRPVKKILLTCSGGPFRGYNLEQLSNVTLEQALKHPKWNMGKKITIDSATLMNKGLEVIEAKWLFGVEPKNIQVLIHPQSIVHSGVEFMDNSVLCQLGLPDMKIPISLAMGYPDRLENTDQELDFFSVGSNLTFEKPDLDTFKCLKLAFKAIEKGGSYPVVMNAANEILVEKFLNKQIPFIDIQNTLEKTLESHKGEYNLSLEDILKIDQETRNSLK